MTRKTFERREAAARILTFAAMLSIYAGLGIMAAIAFTQP